MIIWNVHLKKNAQNQNINRYKEMVNEYRHKNDVKEVYRQKPQHFERFHQELTLLACMNLRNLHCITMHNPVEILEILFYKQKDK